MMVIIFNIKQQLKYNKINLAYNEELAIRVRKLFSGKKGIGEKKMFGGLAFMLKDRMFCGIVKDELMVRVAESKYDELLTRPHAREMDFTGRPMRGFLFIKPSGIKTDKQLKTWLDRSQDFVKTAPLRTRKKKVNKKTR